MSIGSFVVFGLVTSPIWMLAVLTAVGERRRGANRITAAASAVFFPVAWAAWYIRDGRPRD